MGSLSIIIVGTALLLIPGAYFFQHNRKQRPGSFKLVIEKGIIIENNGDVPSEFLYDIQQLARMYKPESLIIDGSGILSNRPKLMFAGTISSELQTKIEQSLHLSLQ